MGTSGKFNYHPEAHEMTLWLATDAMAVTADNEQEAPGPAMSSASVHPSGSGSGAPESAEGVWEQIEDDDDDLMLNHLH